MRLYRNLSLSLVFLALAVSSLAAKRPFPVSVYDSLNHHSVFVYMDQLHSGLSEKEAAFAAGHYVGTQKMPRADIDRIRQYNENFLHLHYKLSITVDSIANYGLIINGDWFSDNRSPLSNWGQVREHPDWFLYNAQNQWVVHGGRRMVMDIANPGFRQWWVTSCIDEMSANGCDGVFADTYTIPAISFNTTYPELFNSVDRMVKEWIPKLNDYGEYVYTALDSAGYYFFPNIDNLQTGWDISAGSHYNRGDFMHGAMMEAWGGWASPADAITGMTLCRQIQDKGVFLHGQGYFGGSGDMNPDLTLAQKRMWMAGTYLLANHGRLYLSMYGPGSQSLGAGGKLLWFPEFEIDLGRYLQEWDDLSELSWQGVYRRDFEKGFVLVNLNSSAKTVDLGGTFYLAEDDGSTKFYYMTTDGTEKVGLKYTAVTALEMPKLSAAVLLDSSPEASGCMMQLKGDFNSDGKVTITDVIKMIIEIRDGVDDPCLDFNGDGTKNITDAVAMILELLHLS